MVDYPDLISDRISALLDAADGLRSEIARFARDVRKIDGMESIEYLADVPDAIGNAESLADQMCDLLESAESDAKKGGQ